MKYPTIHMWNTQQFTCETSNKYWTAPCAAMTNSVCYVQWTKSMMCNIDWNLDHRRWNSSTNGTTWKCVLYFFYNWASWLYNTILIIFLKDILNNITLKKMTSIFLKGALNQSKIRGLWIYHKKNAAWPEPMCRTLTCRAITLRPGWKLSKNAAH